MITAMLLCALAPAPISFRGAPEVQSYRTLVAFLERYEPTSTFVLLPQGSGVLGASGAFERLPFVWQGMAIYRIKDQRVKEAA